MAEVWSGIRWSPAYVAFLYYLAAIITYRLPGASFAAAACLTFLIVQPGQFRMAVPLWVLLAFVLWSGVTVALSEYPAVSLDAWISMGKLFLISVMAYNAIRSREQLRFAMVTLALCFLLFPFRGAMVNYLSGYALFGRAIWNYVYANPNDMAAFALLAASIAASAGSLYRHRLLRVSLFLVALAFCVLVFFTQSRGAIVGLALAGGLFFVSSKRKLQMVVSAIAIGLAAALFAPASVWNRLGGLRKVSTAEGMRGVDEEGSAEQRFQLAQVAVAVIGSHPITGIGLGAYREAHAAQAAQMRAELPIAGGKRDAHNTFLTVTAETGLPGLALFLTMIATSIVGYRRNVARVRGVEGQASLRWTMLGLASFGFAGLFGSYAYLNILYLQLMFMALLGIVPPATVTTSFRTAVPMGSLARLPGYRSSRVTGR